MRPFSLLVKPASADCNLRCRYCFYLDRAELYPESPRHRMSDAVLERMISSFMSTDQPQYGFGWQGGEPTLMGLDFFKRVVALQQQYGRAGSAVSNGLQTNTTLIDDDWARHLRQYHFLVGVSIDGPAALHDHYRVFVNGRGAHADVMRGLECLKRNGVEYNVLTLVSQANVRHPREVYRYLRDDLGVRYHQYIECVEFDAAGEPMPFAVTGAEWGDFLCGIYDEWVAAGDTHRVSVRLFDSILTQMVDHVPNVCAMGRDCRQYLVVEHNGDIYPCDFYVRADLKLGTIMTDEWEALLESRPYADFGAHKRAWNAKCDHCQYLEFCAGCCPKNRPGEGHPGSLSALCDGWMQFYRHALPGLRRLAGEVSAARERERRAMAAQVAASRGGTPVGRNDPCPCGSGLKYKKCCGR